jgi:hypothetical protein
VISDCLSAQWREGGENLLGKQGGKTLRINFPGHSIILTKCSSGGIYPAT